MKKKLLVLLFSLTSLALVSCGGGNDVASTGASAVSAAATTTTEPKVNGQVDERTGVAPVVAQATLCTAPQCPSPPNPWTVYSNGGCANSSYFQNGGNGPAFYFGSQINACNDAVYYTTTIKQCSALGASWCPLGSPQLCNAYSRCYIPQCGYCPNGQCVDGYCTTS
jgi:hypothetical protein